MERLGVDERAFTRGGPHRSTVFVTGLVDLTGKTARRVMGGSVIAYKGVLKQWSALADLP